MFGRRVLPGVLVVAVCGLVLGLSAGCSGGSNGAGSLEGATWYVESYRAAGGGEPTPVLPDVSVTAEFDGDTVSGSGGVNQYSAVYSIDGDQIAIEDIGSTFMAGSEPAMTQEAAYFQALGDAQTYEVADDTLRMSDAAGETVLEFRAGLE